PAAGAGEVAVAAVVVAAVEPAAGAVGAAFAISPATRRRAAARAAPGCQRRYRIAPGSGTIMPARMAAACTRWSADFPAGPCRRPPGAPGGQEAIRGWNAALRPPGRAGAPVPRGRLRGAAPLLWPEAS